MPYEELAELHLFEGVSKQDLERFVAVAEVEQYGHNDQIFGQGAPADKLYVVLAGGVDIRFEPSDGGPLTVTSLERGDVFGWSAALGRPAYTSAAVGRGQVRVVAVQGHLFRRLCQRHPETGVVIIERLAEVIAGRLKSTREAIAKLLQDGVANGE